MKLFLKMLLRPSKFFPKMLSQYLSFKQMQTALKCYKGLFFTYSLVIHNQANCTFLRNDDFLPWIELGLLALVSIQNAWYIFYEWNKHKAGLAVILFNAKKT